MSHDFERFLKKHFIEAESFHPHYQTAINEMLQAGGKRFRPLLLLSVVKAYDPLMLDGALYPALSLEILHTYSLIHDDLPVMDDASLRRGYPTLHKTYDEVTAVLAGDALNTHAFEFLSFAPLHNDVKIALIQTLSRAGGASGMVLGQAIDCHFENQLLSFEELKTLHINKTGKLIAAALKMGGIIVNLSKEKVESLYNFGIDLGLLFQIQDDILDQTQTREEAGRDTDNDGNKNSYVNLLTLEGAIEEAEQMAKALYKQLESFDETLKNELQALLHNYLYRHKG